MLPYKNQKTMMNLFIMDIKFLKENFGSEIHVVTKTTVLGTFTFNL